MRKMILGAVAVSTLATGFAAPAMAQPYGYRDGYQRDYRGDRYDRYDRRDDRRYDRRGYNGYYGQNYGYNDRYYNGRSWRGNDGRYYCRRNDGTTGTLVGAGAGALLGSSVAGRGDRAGGAIIGAIVGGLIGNAVERGNNSYCR